MLKIHNKNSYKRLKSLMKEELNASCDVKEATPILNKLHTRPHEIKNIYTQFDLRISLYVFRFTYYRSCCVGLSYIHKNFTRKIQNPANI